MRDYTRTTNGQQWNDQRRTEMERLAREFERRLLKTDGEGKTLGPSVNEATGYRASDVWNASRNETTDAFARLEHMRMTIAYVSTMPKSDALVALMQSYHDQLDYMQTRTDHRDARNVRLQAEVNETRRLCGPRCYETKN